MSPLAYLITKDAIARHKEGSPLLMLGGAPVLEAMNGIRCFDFSRAPALLNEVRSLVADCINPTNSLSVVADEVFLPAPKTWLEFRLHGFRLGYLITDLGDDFFVHYCQSPPDSNSWALLPFARIPSGRNPSGKCHFFGDAAAGDWGVADDLSRIYGGLIMVNSKNIAVLEEKQPHKRLVSEAHKIGFLGAINRWSEIKLGLIDTDRINEGGSGKITGKKCLHFCRSHLRIRRGRLERVRAHLRGDAQKGVIHGRYAFTH